MSGVWVGVIWRAINRSLVIGFVILFPIMLLHSYEFWYLGPGEGVLNSSVVTEVPAQDKWRAFGRDLMLMPFQLLAIAGVIFAVQAPLLIVKILRP
jgi:hypothetical protein